MTNRLWTGIRFDNIYAAFEWSSYGTPQPGDTLTMVSGGAFLGSGNLFGNTLILAGLDASTQPLVVASSSAVSLSVQIRPLASSTSGYGAVKIVGSPHVDLTVDGGYLGAATGSVTIDGYSTWKGSFAVPTGSLTVTAPRTSLFANENSYVGAYHAGHVQIDANVVGVGSFDVGFYSELDLNGSVASGQTINNSGRLHLNDVKDFHGFINLDATIGADITLAGLTADMFSYTDGKLSLFQGGKDVKDLNLHSDIGVSVSRSGGDLHVAFSFDTPQGLQPIPVVPVS